MGPAVPTWSSRPGSDGGLPARRDPGPPPAVPVARKGSDVEGLLVLVLLAAGVFFLATSGLLIGPTNPRSGPEAWVVDDRAPPAAGTE